MTRVLRIAPAFFCALLYPFCAYSGAWLQPKGQGSLITTALYYRTDTFYDRSGLVQAQDPFSKTEINPYLEYGLADWLTVGGNLLLDNASSSNNPFNRRDNYYVAQAELFARTALWKDATRVISIQPLVKLPTYYFSNHLSDSKNTFFDGELSVLYGQSFTLYGFRQFIDLGAGYRIRDGAPNNQYRVSATYGVHLNDEWMVLAQSFTTLASRIAPNAPLTQRPEDDYDLAKIQLSAVYQLNDSWSVQAGGFAHTAARNTGGDGGFFTALWWNF